MKTRKITTAFAALLFGTVAAFGAEPRVWTNSRGEIALRGTLDVERTLDETPGVEAPNRVYFVDATGDLYSFRYRHLSEADRALVDEALDAPAPPQKVGTRRDVATPLGTPVRTFPVQTAPLEIPASRPQAEANLVVAPSVVSPKSDAFFSSERSATVRVKIKLVDATGAPIPRAWFQGKILGCAATTSLRAHSDSDGGFTLALTPGVEYEALVRAPRGGAAVFYERAKFRAPEANFDAASLTLNVGEGKEMKLTDRAAQEISNEFCPADEKFEALAIETKPAEAASNDENATLGATLGSAGLGEASLTTLDSTERAASLNSTPAKSTDGAALLRIPTTTLKVVDADGNPVPNAKIDFKERGSNGGVGHLTADAQGVQIIRILGGAYDATITTENGRREFLSFIVPREEDAVVELKIGGEAKPAVDEEKPTEDASNAETSVANATLGATLGSAPGSTLAFGGTLGLTEANAETRPIAFEAKKEAPTTIKIVDANGKPVPAAVVETLQVTGNLLANLVMLRADGAGVVSAPLLRGVEYEATVLVFAPRDIPERGAEEEKDELVALVAERYEGLRFTVPEGENVVELQLVDDANVSAESQTTEPKENALNDGTAETSGAEETSATAPISN